MEPWEREYRTGRKRNETKRNETIINGIEQKRTRSGEENGTKRNGPPLVPTRRGGKQDETARFVETI